jgi:hypothetical protein
MIILPSQQVAEQKEMSNGKERCDAQHVIEGLCRKVG